MGRLSRDHMTAVSHLTTGIGESPPRLTKKLGMTNKISNLISTAYRYGKLGIEQGQNLLSVGVDKIGQLLKTADLNSSQQQSIEQLKIKAQQSMDSLTQKVITGVVTSILNFDLKSWPSPQSRQQLIHQLKDQCQDWKKDWTRITQTEVWDTKLQGEAETMLHRSSPDKVSDTLVYKLPNSNACAKCKQLYLESDGITPRVFKLVDLISHGTNFGKNQSDWVATLGTVHPNCCCSLKTKPQGTKFDGNGNLVSDK